MKIGELNLFPLNVLAKGDERSFAGYYMDADGKVYSTRATTLPKLMSGGRPQGGGHALFYTFTGYNGRYAKRYEADKLVERAKKHRSFAMHTGSAAATTATEKPVWPCPFIAGMEAKGWMIASVIGKKIAIVGTEIYTTPDLTQAALVKAAQEKPGTKFVSLKIDRTVVANGLVWN